MAKNEERRPSERQCDDCKQWLHHGRFRTWKDFRCTTVSEIQFSPRCRDCEQRARNIKKNEDRPKAIIEQRARRDATRFGVSFNFLMKEMNYRGLIPLMRAMMTPEAICLSCGHRFVNERDIQFEHRAPVRHNKDWGRIIADNIALACGSCNRRKGKKPYEAWLDEQEAARRANLEHPCEMPALLQAEDDQLPLPW